MNSLNETVKKWKLLKLMTLSGTDKHEKQLTILAKFKTKTFLNKFKNMFERCHFLEKIQSSGTIFHKRKWSWALWVPFNFYAELPISGLVEPFPVLYSLVKLPHKKKYDLAIVTFCLKRQNSLKKLIDIFQNFVSWINFPAWINRK